MAALRLGIADAVTVAKGVVDVCRIGHETKEAAMIVAEMGHMRAHLVDALEHQADGHKSPAAARPETPLALKPPMESLQNDILKAEDMLNDQGHKSNESVLDILAATTSATTGLDVFRELEQDSAAEVAKGMEGVKKAMEEETPMQKTASIQDTNDATYTRRNQGQDTGTIIQKLGQSVEGGVQSGASTILKELENSPTVEGTVNGTTQGDLPLITNVLSIQALVAPLDRGVWLPKPNVPLDFFESGSTSAQSVSSRQKTSMDVPMTPD